jgi:hypothetical protein
MSSDFSIDSASSRTVAIVVDSASNRFGYQKIFLLSRERPARKADNLIAISELIV